MEEQKFIYTHTEHLFEYRSVERKKLTLSLLITFAVMLIELAGGFLTNSIALISDAGHMFTHAFAIGISLIAIVIAKNPPCHHRTFGLYRTEILAAFLNGGFLLLAAGVIIYEAIQRIIHPEEVLGIQMLMIALLGLMVNLASIFILHGHHKEELNIKSVFSHMIADAASSVGIIIAAVAISYTGWNIIDPLVSIGISVVIIFWAWGVLKESVKILLEMAPSGLDVGTIAADLKNTFPEIKEIFNIHVWTITSDMFVFTAHMKLNGGNMQPSQNLLSMMSDYLSEKYNIIESTIQIAHEHERRYAELPTGIEGD
jgi:cobalt-zinc-cadmium efflux system protein